jgi:hypothetical protein
MKRLKLVGAGTALALALAVTPVLADPHHEGCRLDARADHLKHIVFIQFDNVHLRRDNPNVPSDLEQIPSLLHFLEGNGTLLTNHHTPLISHTSVDIVTALTGVYGDKFGVPIGNSIGLFNPATGVASFPSSFTYWTDVLADGTPEMLAANGKNAPAPWVPFTRAGCDVGAFSIANLEFENISSDINNVFGPNSPEAQEATSNFRKAIADFEGIIVHCARGSALCAHNGAPDLLADEPGGYDGYTALYGNLNVQPQISPNGPILDLDGNAINDGHGNNGFPGFSPTPAQTLGYLATMLEAGVQVVYGYIEDAHDNHGPQFSGVSSSVAGTFGPGEAGYVTQLKAYDKAFGEFFARLAADGITRENTLFIVTADENDHFAGSGASPANCDGVTVPCTYAHKGEIDVNLDSVLFTEFGDATPFGIHFDDAATFYINGNPSQTDPRTRALERESSVALGFDVIRGGDNLISQALADRAEQSLLHMVSADPNRTPNFILFGNPDYFFETSGKSPPPACTPATDAASCFVEGTGFAWNHGDFQQEITHTWLGMAGPGVAQLGRFGEIFTDHTDIRPTLIYLAGLRDDYAHDGRVLFESLTHEATQGALRHHRDTLSALAAAYKEINAPLGKLGLRTLTGISTEALSGDDATYAALEAKIGDLTARRNVIAGEMIDMLEDAAFDQRPIDEDRAWRLIEEAQDLLASVSTP